MTYRMSQLSDEKNEQHEVSVREDEHVSLILFHGEPLRENSRTSLGRDENKH